MKMHQSNPFQKPSIWGVYEPTLPGSRNCRHLKRATQVHYNQYKIALEFSLPGVPGGREIGGKVTDPVEKLSSALGDTFGKKMHFSDRETYALFISGEGGPLRCDRLRADLVITGSAAGVPYL